MIRKIQRAALDSSLKAARALPDTTAKLLGRQDAGIALDRADAEVRDVAGRLLFDRELREDARLRRTAARERSRALKLRGRAQEISVEADDELAERERQAEERRRQAAQRATSRKQQAERRRDTTRKQAAQRSQERAQAAEKAERRKQEAIDGRAKRERLEVLKRTSDALGSKTEATTARDEALRLKRAAAETKAQRKQRPASK